MKKENPNTPERIGRYQIVEKIGEGGMSIVYKAYDAKINRNIAIKLMRKEVAEPGLRARFIREAKAAGKLTHPNIVTIYDVGEYQRNPCIAMEYIDGPTLQKKMSGNKKLPLHHVLDIGIQLAEALHYSHEQGVIHRDIKPSNIIMSRNGHSAHITDFGIARFSDPGTGSQTIQGTILGTPQYMSPEQVEGTPVDKRSDLFSVGVVLYQLITGQRPFSSRSLISTYQKIMQEDPPAIDKLVPSVSPTLKYTIDKLLQKDPAKRFRSGAELVNALRHLQQETTLQKQHKAEARLIPLRIKYTVTLAILVFVAMVISSVLIHRKEINTLTSLALDFGSSLARFVSTQTAESMVMRDWVAIELFTQNTQESQQISYLHIVDHTGIIRGTTQPEKQGQLLAETPNKRVINQTGLLLIHEVKTKESSILDFEVPIHYMSKPLGKVHLGLSQKILNRAANLTLYTMIGLTLAVVFTVMVAAYLLGSKISAPIKIMRDALQQATQGNFSHRIALKRNDELGQMFVEFNLMVESFEKLQNKSKNSTEKW